MRTPGPWTASETNQINYMGDTLTVEVIYRGDRDGQTPIAFVPVMEDAQLIEKAPDMEWQVRGFNLVADADQRKAGIAASELLAMVDALETQLENLWTATKGVHPETGKAWLTPKMEREANNLAARL